VLDERSGRRRYPLKSLRPCQRTRSIDRRTFGTWLKYPHSHRHSRIIHKLITKEEQYIQDLDIIETVFIRQLRMASPQIMTPLDLEDFIEEVFGNIMELRECNQRLLEVMYVRQREQHPVIQSVGDIFLDAATEFRIVYPIYVGHHPLAEKRMKEELEHNPEFRFFIEVGCSHN